ncbi:Purine nucleoside phosphorylase [Mycoplasma yeatsii 13926]|uniref:Uridine phosphorylase n=1 Tax=Mycoplasma yeatsii 13926 TaxID=1188240 RepID=S6G814_9MOLU|nr:purine-nucleoside phosphorylase [Mycoplasma yeatsii]EOA07094.1 Purine nucleoside phosphorylase [Mycoplasma yeatsii 13926]
MHINKKADIAQTVLIAGDPRRTKWAAENLLTDYKLVSEVRNAFVYTGMYNGHKVSFATSGMGQPSIAIYVTELFNDHNVQKIVRVGTCGTYNNDIKVGTVVEAAKAYSEVNIFEPSKTGWQVEKPSLNLGAGVPVSVHCADVFYRIADLDPKEQGLDVVDMESYALFYLANHYNRQASTILTVTDNLYDHSNDMTADQRELATLEMYKNVLNKLFNE